MAKKKINITPDYAESSLFGALRYYIGRKSIHASMFGPETALYLNANPNFLSKERRIFLAADIRKGINDCIRFCDNILIRGYNDHIDAVSLLCKKIIEILNDENLKLYTDLKVPKITPEGFFDPRQWIWEINLETGKVDRTQLVTEKDYPHLWGPYQEIHDFVNWIKLANWLDPQLTITTNFKGDIKTEPGFYFPSIGRYINEEYVHFKEQVITCPGYIEKPFIDTYVSPEYITNITDKTY